MFLHMMTSSNGNIFCVTGPLCVAFTVHRWILTKGPVTQSFDIFFDLLLNEGWVNNHEAGDLRRHRIHYDVTVIICPKTWRFITISRHISRVPSYQLRFPRYWPFVWGIHWSPINSPHKGQWRGTLMSSLICAWINGWVNNRQAGDLRRHRAHYDVIVMTKFKNV